jgi:hypothetical protein
VHRGLRWGNLRERPVRRPRHRWKDSIKMDQTWGGGVGWVDLAKGKDIWRALLNV